MLAPESDKLTQRDSKIALLTKKSRSRKQNLLQVILVENTHKKLLKGDFTIKIIADTQTLLLCYILTYYLYIKIREKKGEHAF